MSETPRGRATSALAEHAPEHGIGELRVLARGLRHDPCVVDGLVVRVADAANASGEAWLLALIARRVPLPVPKPRFADARLGSWPTRSCGVGPCSAARIATPHTTSA